MKVTLKTTWGVGFTFWDFEIFYIQVDSMYTIQNIENNFAKQLIEKIKRT